ncbi:MAG: type VI secretion system tip protein VgrG [Deltaproteobacteria bacterium]|nr:type VI secretion system tip protein VgrG [Deltaproteobacteria bacterium]
MSLLELSTSLPAAALSVRRFAVREAVSELFEVSVWAVSADQDIDLDALIDQPASLRVTTGRAARCWSGLCCYAEQLEAQPSGLSSYLVRIVPALWKLAQRRNYRIFQHLSVPAIARRLLDEWSIQATREIDAAAHPRIEYRVQYGESDYAFLSRLFEEAGIGFSFSGGGAGGSGLVLSDKLEQCAARPGPALPWIQSPNQQTGGEHVTAVRVARRVRPGAVAIRDFDFRRPDFALLGEAQAAGPGEARYERCHYQPGAFLIEGPGAGGAGAAADADAGRHDHGWGQRCAERALQAERAGGRAVSFRTNAVDLAPGTVLSIDHHPRSDLGAGRRLLVLELSAEGEEAGEWTVSAMAVPADAPYRPPRRTPKPQIHGVQTALVVGPKGEAIHTDKYGRVRIQFPWDREGRGDESSSCWVRVSQGWAGKGFGAMAIPRVGQEVLVAFVGGDPDQPMVVGRVFNAVEAVPYRLPDHKTRSTWRSDSSPGSGGFNEILFEDQAGRELVYVQAERNLRRLVKQDETVTVGGNRQALVKGHEARKVARSRSELTGGNKVEIVGGSRTAAVRGRSQRRVREDEQAQIDGSLRAKVGGDHEIAIQQTERTLVAGDSHRRVHGDSRRRVDGTRSLTVGRDQHERVGANHALEAGGEIHLRAGASVVIDAGSELTIRAGGGYVRLDQSGVTIRGTLVRINSGGPDPGEGHGASPVEPEEPAVLDVPEPADPEPDDVGQTGLGQ